MSKMIKRIPIKERTNKQSAIVSSRFSLFRLLVLIDANEKIQENVSITATQEVNSSTMRVSVGLAMCNDVMTKRQNPKRFAEVFRM